MEDKKMTRAGAKSGGIRSRIFPKGIKRRGEAKVNGIVNGLSIEWASPSPGAGNVNIIGGFTTARYCLVKKSFLCSQERSGMVENSKRRTTQPGRVLYDRS